MQPKVASGLHSLLVLLLVNIGAGACLSLAYAISAEASLTDFKGYRPWQVRWLTNLSLAADAGALCMGVPRGAGARSYVHAWRAFCPSSHLDPPAIAASRPLGCRFGISHGSCLCSHFLKHYLSPFLLLCLTALLVHIIIGQIRYDLQANIKMGGCTTSAVLDLIRILDVMLQRGNDYAPLQAPCATWI